MVQRETIIQSFSFLGKRQQKFPELEISGTSCSWGSLENQLLNDVYTFLVSLINFVWIYMNLTKLTSAQHSQARQDSTALKTTRKFEKQNRSYMKLRAKN